MSYLLDTNICIAFLNSREPELTARWQSTSQDEMRLCRVVKSCCTGRPIGGNDMMIAAVALAEDLVVVTRNTSEFYRIAGLRVETW